MESNLLIACYGKRILSVKGFTFSKISFKNLNLRFSNKGSSIKDVCAKSQKMTPSRIVRKISALAQPHSPLSMRTHHKFQKIRVFCTKMCGRPYLKNSSSPLSANVRIGQILPLPDCGRPL